MGYFDRIILREKNFWEQSRHLYTYCILFSKSLFKLRDARFSISIGGSRFANWRERAAFDQRSARHPPIKLTPRGVHRLCHVSIPGYL